jgi:hypothetical protein
VETQTTARDLFISNNRGRLWRHRQRRGWLNRTIVVVCGDTDNGEGLSFHEYLTQNQIRYFKQKLNQFGIILDCLCNIHKSRESWNLGGWVLYK